MPTRTEEIDLLFITTFYNRRAEIVDNVFKERPFFRWLTTGGKVKTRPGGLAIECPIEIDVNPSAKFLGRKGTVDIVTDRENWLLPVYEWKFAAVPVLRYRVDDVKNSADRTRLIDYVTAKIDNAQNSLIELIERRLIQQGGTPEDPVALETFVPQNPAVGVVGGIDRAVYPAWRSKSLRATPPATLNFLSDLDRLYDECSMGTGGSPDFHLCSYDTFKLYKEEMLQASILVLDQKYRDLGLSGVTYMGAPVQPSEYVANGTWRMLNSKWMELAISSTEPMEMLEWQPFLDRPGDRVSHIVCSLALISFQLRKHGLLYGVS